MTGEASPAELKRLLETLLSDFATLRAAYVHHVGTGCSCIYCKDITAEWMRKRPKKKARYVAPTPPWSA